MTEQRRVSPAAARREKDSVKSETLEDGRYIPYSGGIMGWFENGGVLNQEQGNNYRYHEVIDVNTMRQKLFERWGAGEGANRRISQRREVTKEINLTLSWSDNILEAATKDYSSHGLRLQVLQDIVLLKKGDTALLTLYKNAARTETEMKVETKVMWVTRVGRRRPVWNLGVGFDDISHDEIVQLAKFMGE